MKDIKKYLLVTTICLSTMLMGCVDQSGSDANKSENKTAQIKLSSEETIIATSMATVEICEKLDIELSGIPSSSLSEPPERYKNLPIVGTGMTPDMEIVSSLSPDWILSPVSLLSDLQPKYDAIDTEYAFLNLSSVAGMFKSIQELGEIFGREEEAKKLVDEFKNFYNEYVESHEGKEAPTVLILMGLPGSYVVATENSYVGSLVAMAGGKNVYEDDSADFLNINTEDMLKKNPDIILRTAHAMPEQVMEMFAEEFVTNDIWKHFEAVKSGKVYDLSHEKFGMSAKFNYQEALAELDKIFYVENGEKNE